MKTEVTRKLWFCAGHRVLNHESKCANAHGHNYILHITAEAETGLDAIGRVIDFSVLKEKMGDWIDEFWDHTFIIFNEDKELLEIQDKLSVNKPVWIAPFNPTAENMADFLLNKVSPMLFKDKAITITKIVLFETENCSVEVNL